MTTIYPHEPNILRVIPFTDNTYENSKALAGVSLGYGPIVIRAKLIQGERGPFLSMPARKNEEKGQWFDNVYFQDRTLYDMFEKLAVAQYNAIQSQEHLIAC